MARNRRRTRGRRPPGASHANGSGAAHRRTGLNDGGRDPGTARGLEDRRDEEFRDVDRRPGDDLGHDGDLGRDDDRRDDDRDAFGDPAAGDRAPELDDEYDETPGGLEHAMPDIELARAQVALGRPDLDEIPSSADLEAFEEELSGHRRRERHERVAPRPPGEEVPLLVRFFGFLRGCWHELQRVQWPDRRQVIQATGVVLGFVIVASIFLGVSDVVSSKIVNLIIR